MATVDTTELIGYLASALVVVSLAMTSVVRLRILSLAGSTTFVVYGVLIESPPIIVTNASIAAINVWFLTREFALGPTRGRDLGISRIRPDSPFLVDFVTFHMNDIRRFQPEFAMPAGDDVLAFVPTRDGLPAGLLVGRRHDDELRIDLDYVLGAYRDSRIGRYVFGPGADVFRDLGIERLAADPGTDTHHRYLERVGFRVDGEQLALDL